MSERKVLSKYYPPDFDPSKITRTRKPKDAGLKTQTVRLMAPFSMRCTSCGDYIYKGRKFNARKETTDEKYYNITIYRFYIRCPRCSGEITFKTDPKHMDYECERGAQRNFEPWREAKLNEETEEERLDRLEREEAERDTMKELEAKVLDEKTSMAVADALDEIRSRNARVERKEKEGVKVGPERSAVDDELERQEREDEEAARRAFAAARMDLDIEIDDEVQSEKNGMSSAQSSNGSINESNGSDTGDSVGPAMMPPPSFTRKKKAKKDYGAALGIKKKVG